MQDVFEKIIKKLESKIFSAELYGDEWNGQTVDNLLCLGDVRDIIEQAAAEYNNGWIPCSERLPEEPNENPLFDNKHVELYLVTTKYGSSEQDKVYPFRAFWNGVNFTDGWHIVDAIAWQPLPLPFIDKE